MPGFKEILVKNGEGALVTGFSRSPSPYTTAFYPSRQKPERDRETRGNQGEFPEIVIPGEIIKDRWRVTRKIGGGGFGDIYEAVDVTSAAGTSEDHVAIKVEPARDSGSSINGGTPACKQVLKMEVFVLKRLQGRPNFCRLLGCGRNDRFSYMVMSLRGGNLAHLRRLRPGGAFSPATCANAGLQMLRALRDVHEAGFLHRDVKPSNFAVAAPNFDSTRERRRKRDSSCHHSSRDSGFNYPASDKDGREEDTEINKEKLVGNGSRDRTIYAIDFGLARQYVDSFGQVRPPRQAAGFRGTVRYASVNAHHNKDLSRRDDIWSLFYVLVEFALGNLPWRKVRDKDAVARIKETFDFGAALRRGEAFPELAQFHEYLTTLDSYYDIPDYSHLRSLLLAWRDRIGDTPHTPYDWERRSLSKSPNHNHTKLSVDIIKNKNGDDLNQRLSSPPTRNELRVDSHLSTAVYRQRGKTAPNFSATHVIIKPKHDKPPETSELREYFMESPDSNEIIIPITNFERWKVNHDSAENRIFTNSTNYHKKVKSKSVPADGNGFNIPLINTIAPPISPPVPTTKLISHNYVVNNAWIHSRMKPHCDMGDDNPFRSALYTIPSLLHPSKTSGAPAPDSGKGESSAAHSVASSTPAAAIKWKLPKQEGTSEEPSDYDNKHVNRPLLPKIVMMDENEKKDSHFERDSRNGPEDGRFTDKDALEVYNYSNARDTRALAESEIYTFNQMTKAPSLSRQMQPTTPSLHDNSGSHVPPYHLPNNMATSFSRYDQDDVTNLEFGNILDEDEAKVDINWERVTIDPSPKYYNNSYHNHRRLKHKTNTPRQRQRESQAVENSIVDMPGDLDELNLGKSGTKNDYKSRLTGILDRSKSSLCNFNKESSKFKNSQEKVLSPHPPVAHPVQQKIPDCSNKKCSLPANAIGNSINLYSPAYETRTNSITSKDDILNLITKSNKISDKIKLFNKVVGPSNINPNLNEMENKKFMRSKSFVAPLRYYQQTGQ
ncbi:unnamed protein product [Gordionus sp. m RMFG-2023]|uniref:tau-tubulin kinase 1-like n=1 Tax=Gordionus sp. m RMFG-2023 TaxID=3053472 RepID=UPI0030DEB6E3